jgi:hypothetical protein
MPGYRLERNRPSTKKVDHQNRIGKLKMTCPKFGCDQWKLASLKHAEGTSTKKRACL